MRGPAGFSDWYAIERPALYATLAVVTGERELSAEAADEALARAYERWDTVSAMRSPAGWTYVTALNVLRRLARRRAIEAVLHRRAAAAAPEGLGGLISPELADVVRNLPERTRLVVGLFYVADRPVAEIAETLGVAPSTVTSMLTGARARLRRALSEGAAP